jgi:hypothetical protein
MLVLGSVQRGQRGIFAPPQGSFARTLIADPVDMPEEEAVQYGVDWDDIENRQLHDHHIQENFHVREEDYNTDPFLMCMPDTLSHVLVPDVRCPFTLDGVNVLDAYLDTLPFRNTFNTDSLQQLWVHGLNKAVEIFQSARHS